MKINNVSTSIQNMLWKIGISIHNPITDECTPDFSCCIGKIRAKQCSQETPNTYMSCLNKNCKECEFIERC